MGTAAGRSVFYARLGPDATTTTVLTCLAYRPNERLPWHAHEQRPQVDWLSGIASLSRSVRRQNGPQTQGEDDDSNNGDSSNNDNDDNNNNTNNSDGLQGTG
ncbi:hypothetical protein ACJQWK_02129 [Exserohilum turcicum]